MDRNTLRTKLLSSRKLRTETLHVWGVDIEFRQPSLGDILNIRDEENQKERVSQMLIQYAFVPGTDEKIFEPGDKEAILAWPFDQDIIKIQEAITALTGIDIEGAENDLEENPLEG